MFLLWVAWQVINICRAKVNVSEKEYYSIWPARRLLVASFILQQLTKSASGCCNFHCILNQHIYQCLANHLQSISHFTTTWRIFQEVLQYLTCPCTRAKTSEVATGSPPRHYFTTSLWSLFLYLSTHHIKHSVHTQTKASNIIKQIIEVACKFDYYNTLYSLSAFSLAESPLVILKISTTYRLVSYLPAD